jgi:hypothetical protein
MELCLFCYTEDVNAARRHPANLCYKFQMKIIEQWLLFKYVNGEFTPLSKPFKTKAAAEKARLKLPERERREVAIGVVRTEK